MLGAKLARRIVFPLLAAVGALFPLLGVAAVRIADSRVEAELEEKAEKTREKLPKPQIGRAQQATINLQGANCIRVMNGALKVWGARTLGGNNSAFKYIPIRRLMSFLNKSIDHGTQWAVFEPNGPHLWAKIIRNVSSFLTGVWAQGALFGTTPQEAFYVKCDAENNPPDQRAHGQLIVEVGVAVLYQAEFVVFKIQHQSSLAK